MTSEGKVSFALKGTWKLNMKRWKGWMLWAAGGRRVHSILRKRPEVYVAITSTRQKSQRIKSKTGKAGWTQVRFNPLDAAPKSMSSIQVGLYHDPVVWSQANIGWITLWGDQRQEGDQLEGYRGITKTPQKTI